MGAQFRELAKGRVAALEDDGRLVRAGEVLVAPAGASAPGNDGRSGTATLH